MKSKLFFAAVLLFLLVGCSQSATYPDPHSTDAVGKFSMYLVKEGVSAQQILEIDVSELELESTPILSIEDIVVYSWETHEIELTDSAYETIKKLDVPGLPFVVRVGSESIYSGAFWVSYSSMSFGGIVIDTLLGSMDERTIRIQLGYPESPDLFVGEDLRSDTRILQSLQDAGKVK